MAGARVNDARAAAGHHRPDAAVAVDHCELQRRTATVAVEPRDRLLLHTHREYEEVALSASSEANQ